MPLFIFEEVSNSVTKAQLDQHNSTKKQQTHKFQSLLDNAYETETRPTHLGAKHSESTTTDVQDKWVKNLSHSSFSEGRIRRMIISFGCELCSVSY